MSKARKRSDAARRGWQTRRARIEATLARVDELAQYARATAEGLRVWYRNNHGARVRTPERDVDMVGQHPMHAANRLDKLAEQLSSSKRIKQRKGE